MVEPAASPKVTGPVVRLHEDREWDRTADVVVVGTGVSGCSVAVNCADLGASVVMLEKGETTGGTSAKSGAASMVPNNRFLQAAGRHESKEEFIRLLARIGRPLLYNPTDAVFGLPQWEYDLIEAYYDNAADAWSHIENIGAMRIMHYAEWPSYLEVREDKFALGRVLFPQDDAGELANGRVAIDQMIAKAVDLGVELVLQFAVDGLYVNQIGEVVGVRGTENGEARSIRAMKAVVFASGGFTHSQDYVREYLNGQVVGGCASRTNTGDIIPIAKSLGLPLYQMQSAFYSPLVYEQSLDADQSLISNFSMAGDSVLSVNKYGVRVCNEKAPYHDRTQSHFIWDPAMADYPNFLQFAVMDQRCRERFSSKGLMDHQAGNFIPAVGEDSGYFLKAPTLDTLASEFSRRLAERAYHHGGIELSPDFADNLRATIERFNEFARLGSDADFHRGETAIEKIILERQDDNDLPNPALFPISDTGPYYGTILAPGALDTKGGPKVNSQMQMLDWADEPVPGLYGIGNCVASAAGQAYWSGGSTWGPYLTFGYIAAQRILVEAVKHVGAVATTTER